MYNLSSLIKGNIVNASIRILRPDTIKHIKLMQEAELWSYEKVKNEQLHRLNLLLTYAAQHVPFYRERFHKYQVINGNDNINIDAFYKMPCLTKSEVRNFKNELVSDELSKFKYKVNYSGGSTGEPTQVFQESRFAHYDMGNNIFVREAWGNIRLGDRMLRFWGNDKDIFLGQESITSKIRNWLYNVHMINAFRISNKVLEELTYELKYFKPRFLISYAHSLYEVAKFFLASNISLPSPKMIITSAGPLFPDFRKAIESVFPESWLCNRYGSREVGDMAFSCPKSAFLHEMSFTHLIEIVDDAGIPCEPGTVGNIAVTCLTNRAFPLIRYLIGDRGVWAEDACICGRPFPVLKEISGRTSDVLINSYGDLISPETIVHTIGVFLHLDRIIKRFQVIQDDYDYLIVLLQLEAGKSLDKSIHESICKCLKTIMNNPNTRIEIKIVDDIPPNRSGKHRYTICNINHAKNLNITR